MHCDGRFPHPGQSKSKRRALPELLRSQRVPERKRVSCGFSGGVVASAYDLDNKRAKTMDTERWNITEERRIRKLQQIRQLLSIALGPDVDLNQEAKNLIDQWEEAAAIEIRPTKADAPLHCLLREYHEICESIPDLEGEKRPSKM